MAFTETLTADGQTAELIAFDDFQLHVKGTFGSGTIVIQQVIGGNFESLAETQITADFDKIFQLIKLSNGNVYRFDLSGSTTPSITITALGDVRPNI
jgi:hypothetical protein